MVERSAQPPEEIGQFFSSQWTVYERMVRFNLLRHKEMFACLREDLQSLKPGFSLLDLASGDAGSLAVALQGLRVSRCVAVDLAGGPVLLAARDNLRFRGIPAEVKALDFLRFVQSGCKQPFDAVTIAYSLHHLDHGDKQHFFQGVAQWIKPGGSLWVIDGLVPPGETPELWVAKVISHLHLQGETVYNAAEWQTVENHIGTCDHPEEATALHEMAKAAGFQSMTTRLLLEGGLLGMLRFQK